MKSLDYYPTIALVEALLERIEHSNGLDFVPNETRLQLAQALTNYTDTEEQQ